MKVYKNLTELIADHKDVVYPDGNTDVILNERAVLVAIRTVAKVYKTTNGEYICDPIINRYYVVRSVDEKNNKSRIVSITDSLTDARRVAKRWNGKVDVFVDDGNEYWCVKFMKFGGFTVVPVVNHNMTREQMKYDPKAHLIFVAAPTAPDAISKAVDEVRKTNPEVFV